MRITDMDNVTLQFVDMDKDWNEMLCSISVSPILANHVGSIIERELVEKENRRTREILKQERAFDDYEDMTDQHQQQLACGGKEQ